MYVPLLRESVRLKDHDGLYTVVHADYRRQMAELIGAGQDHQPIKTSFAALFAAFEDPSAPPPQDSISSPTNSETGVTRRRSPLRLYRGR